MKVPRRKYAQETLDIESLVDRAIELEEDEQRGYLGGSQIGWECERALWYSFRWAQQPDFPPRIRRRFKTGDYYEERIVARLRQVGFEVRNVDPLADEPGEQFSASWFGGVFGGHQDGFIRGLVLGEEWALLEVKAMASAKYEYDDETGEPVANKTFGKIEGRWWETHRRGVKATQQTHFAQLQSYMGLSHEPGVSERWGLDAPLTRAVYIAVNTDTEQIHDELVPYSPRWWDRIKARVIRVARAKMPPPRIYESPEAFTCRYCDYRDVCHGGLEPDQNCRTCRHVLLALPGDGVAQATWFCRKLECETDQVGCPEWEQFLEPMELF